MNTMNLLIPFTLCHPISLSSILILPSHLQLDLQCAVFNVCTSLLHHTYHCSTSRKVAGSTPDGVIGIFHWHNPSGRTLALGSTQPPIQMSTRNIFGGKEGRCVGMTILPTSCADYFEIWDPQPPRTLRACPALHRDWFFVYFLLS